MKICFYCDSVFTYGGVQRVLTTIANELANKGYSITILTQDDPTIENYQIYQLNGDKVDVEYIRFKGITPLEYLPCKAYSLIYKQHLIPQNRITSAIYGYSSFPHSQREHLIARLNEGNYDLIIGVHAFVSLQLASIKKRLTCRQVIGWMHTSYDAFFSRHGFYLFKQKRQFQYEMQKLDKVVVLTHYDQRKFKEEMALTTHVIYNPVCISTTGYKGQAKNKKFIAVGRMSPQTKGFDLLIEAFHLFSKKNNDWKLEIVGDGVEKKKLEELIKKYQLGKRVTIEPFTTHIERHYMESSIFVLSSRWEGFPLVLLEAMHHHLPIIATQLPVTKEVLKDFPYNPFFENESIHQLAMRMEEMTNYSDEELNKFGEFSYHTSLNYTIAATIEQWVKLLNR